MTFQKLQKHLQNKIVLIGLSFSDENGEFIENYQTHGSIKELREDGILTIIKRDGNIFQLPYDPDNITKAPKGDYKEKSTGLVITNPDFLIQWEISLKDEKNLNTIKEVGYKPSLY